MSKSDLSLVEFRDEVARRVAEHFKGKSWYHEACMDHVDSRYPDLEAAVDASIDDTWYHDGWIQ